MAKNLTTSYSSVFLSAIAALLYVWYIVPSIKYEYISTIVGAVVIAYTLLFILFRPAVRHFYYVLIGLTIAYSLVTFFIPAGLDFGIGFLPMLEYSFFILPMIMAYDIIVREDQKSAFLLMVYLAIMFYIVYHATIVVLIENPGAARDLAQGLETKQLMEWRFGNVGGFGFSYCAAPVGLMLLELTLKSKGLYKVVAAFFFVYISIFIFLVQYTTLLVFFAVGCILLVYRTFHSPMLKFSIIAGAILVCCFMTEILSLISDLANDGGYYAIAHHFDDFAGTTQGHDLKSSRSQLASDALNLWLDSPLWGNFGISTPVNPKYNIVVWAHSGVAVVLANSGLIGLFLHFAFLIIAWKYIRRALKARECNPLVFDISFLFLVMVDFINPIFSNYEIPLMTFLFVPISIFYFKKYFKLNNGVKKACVN